jgi:hypothetical protein
MSDQLLKQLKEYQQQIKKKKKKKLFSASCFFGQAVLRKWQGL